MTNSTLVEPDNALAEAIRDAVTPGE